MPRTFETEAEDGSAVIVVGASLLDQMRSDDEIAFVLSHEMSHHIAGHIPKQQAQAAYGAALFGGLAALAANAYGIEGLARLDRAGDEPRRRPRQPRLFPGLRARGRHPRRLRRRPRQLRSLDRRPALRAPRHPQRGGNWLLTTHPGSTEREANIARVEADIRAAGGPRPLPDAAARL
ncbi:MAG: M48 family metalloprotease [Amaricoccus sp.]